MSLTPVLIGINGICAGEHFVLAEGQRVNVGRSSSCEVCLQRVPRFLMLSDAERAALIDFNIISRVHVTIIIKGSVARLENHSPIGTWCDDARFDKAKEVDLAISPVTLRLGPIESLQFMLLDNSELDRLSARTTPLHLNTTKIGNEEGLTDRTRPRPSANP